eukprot:Nk52_evm11s442 gene=Nk52_evmTU11s442
MNFPFAKRKIFEGRLSNSSPKLPFGYEHKSTGPSFNDLMPIPKEDRELFKALETIKAEYEKRVSIPLTPATPKKNSDVLFDISKSRVCGGSCVHLSQIESPMNTSTTSTCTSSSPTAFSPGYASSEHESDSSCSETVSLNRSTCLSEKDAETPEKEEYESDENDSSSSQDDTNFLCLKEDINADLPTDIATLPTESANDSNSLDEHMSSEDFVTHLHESKRLTGKVVGHDGGMEIIEAEDERMVIEVTEQDEREHRFRCPNCEKAYSTKNGLKYHVRSAHTGEISKTVTACKKVFRLHFTKRTKFSFLNLRKPKERLAQISEKKKLDLVTNLLRSNIQQ